MPGRRFGAEILEPPERPSDPAVRKANLRRIFPLFRPYRARLAVVCGLSLHQSRWLRQAPTPRIDPGTRVEGPSDTARRSLIHVLPAIAAVAVCTMVSPGVGVIVGGVVAAVGLIDLRNRSWAQEREREGGSEILRELGRSPFAAGRRPLYTRPRKASTLRT